MDTMSEKIVPEAEDISLSRRFLRKRTLLSFLIAFGILAVFVARLDVNFGELAHALMNSNLGLLVLAYVVYYGAFPLRAARWRLFLNNVGFHKGSGIKLPSLKGLSRIILLGWFANCIVPAKLGDAYRVYLLKNEAKVSFSTTAGTVMAERIIDMLILFVLLAVAALGMLGGKYSSASRGVMEAGFIMALILALLLIAMRYLGHRLQRLLPLKARDIYARFQEGTLSSFRQLPLVVGLTIVIWLLEASRLLMVTWSLHLSLVMSLILFVALANAVLTVLPFTPGGLGLVEAGIVGLLMLALTKEQAISVALLDRIVSYWSLIVFGLIAFLLARRKY